MSNSGCICIQEDGDGRVHLYTHWDGPSLPQTLQEVLRRKERWDDSAYLARMIFEAMIEEDHGGESGFGIAASPIPADYPPLIVDCRSETVVIDCEDFTRAYTFEEYIDLDPLALMEATQQL